MGNENPYIKEEQTSQCFEDTKGQSESYFKEEQTT
jgi:hypothetical protein